MGEQCSDRRLPCQRQVPCLYPLLPSPEIYLPPESCFPGHSRCYHNSHIPALVSGLVPPHVQPLPHHSSFLTPPSLATFADSDQCSPPACCSPPRRYPTISCALRYSKRVLPISSMQTNFTLPPATFLSVSSPSSKFSRVSVLGITTGSPAFLSSRHTRSLVAALHNPRWCDRCTANAMPIATASPWRKSLYSVALSIACPKV